MNNKRLIEIDVRRCFKALKTHLSWIFMSAILFLAIGIVFALATEEKQDMYKASSSVYCITEGGDYSATYDSTKLMMTYAGDWKEPDSLREPIRSWVTVMRAHRIF